MWTDGQRTKTNPKTSREQSAIFQLAKNVTSIVKTAPPPWQPYMSIFENLNAKWDGKTDRQTTGTIFKLYSRIKETKVLTKFHENWAKNVTSRVLTCFHYIHIEKNATGGHVFSPIWTIFELVREINKNNVLTNFHDDWAKIVTSRVFTRKTAPPTGSHVFQRTGTIFELNQHLLTKFHEDRTINVAFRVFTNQC
ncbi:hypothetical protein DPMN_063669 [Dreissena polymorpha]|uniref:Uncharacterized protein n=1 Tax=Dreissena polymorpha TaxID=45954 RepID=A0A9D4CC01_DREPO|nr:hypothetical protein DPMN_063669 [Dreissena polymorpha]